MSPVVRVVRCAFRGRGGRALKDSSKNPEMATTPTKAEAQQLTPPSSPQITPLSTPSKTSSIITPATTPTINKKLSRGASLLGHVFPGLDVPVANSFGML